MEKTKSSYPYYPGYKDKEGSTSVEAAELIAAGSVTIREKVFNVVKKLLEIFQLKFRKLKETLMLIIRTKQ